MLDEINKPIFVVGSPRSGTSILALFLGYHPNIFPVPESNWIGDFAVNALFIHIVRDVGSVVRTMLNFHRIAGTNVVPNEEEAYRYWLRTVRACLKAEGAYGPRVVYRLRYTALVENSESARRSLLDFSGEPYSANCLEPLSQRLNSSNVPADFKFDDPATDPAVAKEARRLSSEIEQAGPPGAPSSAAADELKAEFDARVKYIAAFR